MFYFIWFIMACLIMLYKAESIFDNSYNSLYQLIAPSDIISHQQLFYSSKYPSSDNENNNHFNNDNQLLNYIISNIVNESTKSSQFKTDSLNFLVLLRKLLNNLQKKNHKQLNSIHFIDYLMNYIHFQLNNGAWHLLPNRTINSILHFVTYLKQVKHQKINYIHNKFDGQKLTSQLKQHLNSIEVDNYFYNYNNNNSIKKMIK
jgi:hypothetical protein